MEINKTAFARTLAATALATCALGAQAQSAYGPANSPSQDRTTTYGSTMDNAPSMAPAQTVPMGSEQNRWQNGQNSNMNGNMPGNMNGNMPDNMNGNMPGNMNGNTNKASAMTPEGATYPHAESGDTSNATIAGQNIQATQNGAAAPRRGGHPMRRNHHSYGSAAVNDNFTANPNDPGSVANLYRGN